MSFPFNSDGSLAVTKVSVGDHVAVLKAIDEIPFGVGKKLLIDFLRGRENSRTRKLNFDRLLSFGELGGFQEDEIARLLQFMEREKFVEVYKQKGLYPVLGLTEKGHDELAHPSSKILINELEHQEQEQLILENPFTEKTVITDKDRTLFSNLKGFFDHFNDEQKKAVICPAKNILCVAGAGSGKTSVLIKRIEFLIHYKGVDPKNILAITFTRKAKWEMLERLSSVLGANNAVTVETFNSFSEKILQKHGLKLYQRQVRMISRKEFIGLVNDALRKFNLTPASIVLKYFTQRQRQGKDSKQLFFSFLYDLQALIDRRKLTAKSFSDLKRNIDHSKKYASLAELIIDLAKEVDETMFERGLRDFTDQVMDAIRLFDKNPDLIPVFDHILVDEYQDVNEVQIRLLDILSPRNLFVVGDPRQSIYGWRGSKVSYIIDFANSKEDSEIIQLTTNYRSTKDIVGVCNSVSKSTGYHALNSVVEEVGVLAVRQYKGESEQASAICQEILTYDGNKKEIFILARTNRALKAVQDLCDALNIPYLLRTEDNKRPLAEAADDQITLATVHAIKGLEADRVYIIGANTQNFPCKASDHPVMDMFSLQEDYDSYAEELRVFYVALSRARRELFICYHGTITSFLPEDVVNNLMGQKKLSGSKRILKTDFAVALMKLRRWRYNIAKERGCPAYMICSDKSLHSLLEILPSDLDELMSVKGFGRQKVEEFGKDLLWFLRTL